MAVYETTPKVQNPTVKTVWWKTPIPRIIKFWLQSILLQAIWIYSRLRTPEPASDFGAYIMRKIAPRLQKYQKTVLNLKVAFPEKTEDEITELALDSVATLGRVIVEYPHLKKILGTELGARVEFVSKDPKSKLEPGRRPALFIAAHQANWEVFAAVSARLGRSIAIVSTPRPNFFIESMLSKIRANNGFIVIDKIGAMRNIIRHLRNGTAVGILADHRFDNGDMVPFFGRNARTVVGTARLSLRLGYDLIPTRIERVGPVKFRITTYPPVVPDERLVSNSDKAIDMMAQVNHHFEEWIRERPEQWVCTKRRWPGN